MQVPSVLDVALHVDAGGTIATSAPATAREVLTTDARLMAQDLSRARTVTTSVSSMPHTSEAEGLSSLSLRCSPTVCQILMPEQGGRMCCHPSCHMAWNGLGGKVR